MTTIHPKCPRCTTTIPTDSEDAVQFYQQRLYVAIDCPNCGIEIQMRHPDREDFISSLRGEPPLNVTQEIGVNVNFTEQNKKEMLEDYETASEKRKKTGEPDES